MKDFFKVVLASALGFLAANIILFILSMVFFFGIIGSMAGDSTFKLKDNSVLHLKLSGQINERVSEADPLTELLSSSVPTPMGLNDITNSIRKAKDNDINTWYLYRCSYACSFNSITCRNKRRVGKV